MSESSVSSLAIYQFRVVRCGVSPLVWRRLLVVNETSLANSMKSFRVPSAGAANIYTASLYMAWPMGFRMWAASSSGRMLEGCPFPVSVCIAASASAMNTTSRPIGSWTFGLSGLCPLIQNALFCLLLTYRDSPCGLGKYAQIAQICRNLSEWTHRKIVIGTTYACFLAVLAAPHSEPGLTRSG